MPQAADRNLQGSLPPPPSSYPYPQYNTNAVPPAASFPGYPPPAMPYSSAPGPTGATNQQNNGPPVVRGYSESLAATLSILF